MLLKFKAATFLFCFTV